MLRCAALGHRHEASTHGIAGSDAVGRHENPACVLCPRGREGQKTAALRCVQLALTVCSRHGRPTRGRRKYRTCTVQYCTETTLTSLARPASWFAAQRCKSALRITSHHRRPARHAVHVTNPSSALNLHVLLVHLMDKQRRASQNATRYIQYIRMVQYIQRFYCIIDILPAQLRT